MHIKTLKIDFQYDCGICSHTRGRPMSLGFNSEKNKPQYSLNTGFLLNPNYWISQHQNKWFIPDLGRFWSLCLSLFSEQAHKFINSSYFGSQCQTCMVGRKREAWKHFLLCHVSGLCLLVPTFYILFPSFSTWSYLVQWMWGRLHTWTLRDDSVCCSGKPGNI